LLGLSVFIVACGNLAPTQEIFTAPDEIEADLSDGSRNAASPDAPASDLWLDEKAGDADASVCEMAMDYTPSCTGPRSAEHGIQINASSNATNPSWNWTSTDKHLAYTGSHANIGPFEVVEHANSLAITVCATVLSDGAACGNKCINFEVFPPNMVIEIESTCGIHAWPWLRFGTGAKCTLAGWQGDIETPWYQPACSRADFNFDPTGSVSIANVLSSDTDVLLGVLRDDLQNNCEVSLKTYLSGTLAMGTQFVVPAGANGVIPIFIFTAAGSGGPCGAAAAIPCDVTICPK